jgi:hypothetical protein
MIADLKQGFSRLIKRLRALPETNMRLEVLFEWFRQAEPQDIMNFFSRVQNGILHRDHACMEILDAIHAAVLAAQKQGDLYEVLAEVYRLAADEGIEAVKLLLTVAMPRRGPLESHEVPSDLDMSSVTLGMRKYLARGQDRGYLDRLLLDSDPSVVRNLLRNPRLVEQDVVRLAARRPARDIIQREIYSSRWSERYKVRLALVCNPYTPSELAIKLVGFLLRKDLRMVKNDKALHPLVRTEADRLLQAKKVRGDASEDERGN